MKDFVGRVAVVTGAGQGIGRALADRFGREGMKVVVADIVPELVERTATQLRESGVEATGFVTDVASLESLEELRDHTLETFGAVHLLCNNAGIGSGADGQIWEHHLNDWRWSFDVNVFGVINGIHAFVPTMLDQDVDGHVVNTTSANGGFVPLASSAIYAATKATVTTITECLWAQLRSTNAKVGASLLYPSTQSPGLLNTGIWQAGANRPARYDRPGAPPQEGVDRLTPVREQMAAAGIELAFAPLEEVADLCIDGVRNDTFWISATSTALAESMQARVTSQLEQSAPEYLLDPSFVSATLPGDDRSDS